MISSLSRFLAAISIVAMVTVSARADISVFTDYNLGGVTASWDIFEGANYLPTFNFATGTPGNPINSATNLTLVAQNPNHVPGQPFIPQNSQATGPIGSDMSRPGDREQFYTFFAPVINFSVAGAAEGAIDTFVLQSSGSGVTNILLNGLAPTTSSSANGLGAWVWSGLALNNGDNYTVSWSSPSTHSAYDAFQIQTGVAAVPEPASMAVLGLAAGCGIYRTMRRRKATKAE